MPFNMVARVKNMTRETKVGLVVSCSFLCLLGVVLVLKMTERPEEEQSAEVAAAGPNDGPPAAPPGDQVAAQTDQHPGPEEGKEPPALSDAVAKGAIRLTGGATPEAPAASSGPGGSGAETTPPAHLPKDNKGSKLDPKSRPTGPLDEMGIPLPGGDSAPPPPPPAKPSPPASVPVAAGNNQPVVGGNPGGWLGPWKPHSGGSTDKVKQPPVKDGVDKKVVAGPVPLPGTEPADPAGPKYVDPTQLPPMKDIKLTARPATERDGDPMTMAALAKAGDVNPKPKSGTSGGDTLPPPPPPAVQKEPTPSLPDLPPVIEPGKSGGAATPPLAPIPAAPTGPPSKGSWLRPSPPPIPGDKENTVPPPPPPPTPPPVGGGTKTTGTAGSGGAVPSKPTDPVPTFNVKDTVTGATSPPPPSAPDLPPVGGAKSVGTAGIGDTVPTKSADKLPTIDVKGIDTNPTGDKPIKVGAVPPIEMKPTVEPRPAPAPAKAKEPIVVGVTPSASVPPLSIPSSPAVRSAQPDVVSYTEESYLAGAGDSFQSISRAKYGTDTYAQALYFFNRSHPLAEDDLVQSDSLKAKQTVYIPPVEILRSRYAGAIKEENSPVRSGVMVGTTTSQRADTSAAAPRTYRVAASGEKVYDIARNLLGDGNRWVEIQKLNPGWKWDVPLPPGAAIQVPADARLPQ
jgi:hypothetical protein